MIETWEKTEGAEWSSNLSRLLKVFMSEDNTLAEISGSPQSNPVPGPRTSAFRRYLVVTFVLTALFLGVAGWMSYQEWPTGPASGTTFHGSAPVTAGLPKRFKIATFNIHGGYGLDGRLDLKRTAECLQGMDFIGLNEVRGVTAFNSRGQAEQLGELLEMRWLFAPTETGWTGPRFGQGALSRASIESWRVVPFPRVNGNGYRNYLECQIPFESAQPTSGRGKSLTILVTHLDRKSDRQDQLRSLIQHFLELPPPVLLMGDLNAKRTEPQLQELAKQAGVTECFGQFAQEPLVFKRIDWIFVRGLKCLDANLEANDASDHPWGWAELELDK
ncbi:MAG: Endonuclease/exonuclease/phosphatase [Planctomycetaceae bacterium]|nr:Endonuclease/exonuclease/phosphatase [Planctomycetaceae bacterium]